MNPKFNINRPKISDEEIKKNQDFNQLVEQFKKQSLKKARSDESWWKNKRIQYAMAIAGITVICTITYQSLINDKQTNTNETNTTQKTVISAPTPKKSFINEPSQKLKIKYSTYTVNNQKGANITHTSSTKIKIPKSSFIDKNGKEIVGDVTIQYKEFHDLGDVIISGIPMGCDSAGKKTNLESAGMFDIRGYQNGELIFIKPEKSLQVDLVSAKSDYRFNQYYLDTSVQNWQYIKKDVVILHKRSNKANLVPTLPENAKLKSIKKQIEVVLPKKIDSVKIVYTNKIEKLPRASQPNKPVKAAEGKPTFKLEGSNEEFPELASFNNTVFEVGPEIKNYTKDMHEITWSDVKISRGPLFGKNYLLTLSYRNRIEKLVVYPVLTGEDFDKAQNKYLQNLANYDKLLEKSQAEENRLTAEMEAKQAIYIAEQNRKKEEYEKERSLLLAKYNQAEQSELAANFNAMSLQMKASRIFNVSRFGIFNSDCPHPVPTGTSVNPVFVSMENQ